MNTHTDTIGDEQAIYCVIQQAVDAWGAGDGAAYGSAFEADADYITFGGMHERGREAIARGHQQLFDTFLRGSRIKLDVTSLRFLSPEIAVAHAVGGILDDSAQTDIDATRRSIQTMVLRKTDGQWRISASQVTRVQDVQPGVNVPASHQQHSH